MVPFGGDRLIAVDMAVKELCLSVPDGLLDDINVIDEVSGGKIN